MSEQKKGAQKKWIIENDTLEVCFILPNKIFRIKDKRLNKVWEQVPLNVDILIKSVSQTGNILTLELASGCDFTRCASVCGGEGGGRDFVLAACTVRDFTANIELTAGSELVFTVSSEPGAPLDKFYFPAAIAAPDKNHYVLQTDSEGLLLPVDDTFYPMGESPLFYCGGGPGMAWIGVTDIKFETGYMAIFETPFDVSVLLKKENELITFAPVWYSSMGQFGYDRKIRYVFFDQGGYVAQCKRYRAYIWPKNHVVTLSDSIKRFPAIEKIVGAVHIYVWDKAREVGFAQEMKDSGIDKALLLWDANHLPYPSPDYEDMAKELGYGVGGYELFSDIKTETDPYDENQTKPALRRTSYPGLFENIVLRKKDGSTYGNEFGTYTCPEAVRPEIIKRVEKELAVYQHETYFVDVYQANGIYECYNTEHRLSRRQYAEAIIKSYELLQNRYHVFLGAEFGSDFAGSNIIYAHGMMTLQRTWFNSEINDKGTIYYYGNWEDNERPSIMLTARTATNTYLKYSINEYTRVPLYELVYHDAIVSSWRWEDCNHHSPEIWWKKDLFNILYGSAPLWSLDDTVWTRYKQSFIDSYKKICPWLSQICCDELVSHQFITEDHKIQESIFAPGKSVIVNFGEDGWQYEGGIIEAHGFITINDKPDTTL